MIEIIKAAGWPIWPLLAASIISVALIIERLVALRHSKVVPAGLLQRAVGRNADVLRHALGGRANFSFQGIEGGL